MTHACSALQTLVAEDNAAVGYVRFTPNGRFLLVSTLDSKLRLWDWDSSRIVKVRIAASLRLRLRR